MQHRDLMTARRAEDHGSSRLGLALALKRCQGPSTCCRTTAIITAGAGACVSSALTR